MNFQHDKSWEIFETVFDLKLPINESWNRIIDFHEQISSKSYWTKLRQLDFLEEQNNIKEWLESIVTNSPIPDNIVALWIGITKIIDNNKEVYVIYLVGSDSYNKDDIDWATDATYEPENRYGILEVLNKIDKTIKKDENYSFLDWILPISYCAFTIDEIIRTKLNRKLFLKSKSKLFVTTGHDSGDYKELTPIE